MRCPSCGYVSFDHLTTCKNCGKPIPGATGAPRTPAPAPRPRPAPSAVVEPTAAFSTEDLRPAGFWIRFVAAFVDGLVFVAIMFLVLKIYVPEGIFGGEGSVEDKVETLTSALGSVGVLFNLIPLLYSVGFVGWRGQTPGKMLLGLKIIRINGEEVGYLRAFIRWIGQIISSLTFTIGYLIAAFTTHKRALHDYIDRKSVV